MTTTINRRFKQASWLNNSVQTIDWFPLGTFAVSLLLYVLTAAPTVYNLDSAEFSTAVATGGIVRATGYPLYLVLGKLWTFLPVGDIGYRLNLFSAVCGALTLLHTERILHRIGVGALARVGALGLLATAPYFWAMSLIAEVYTLHTALMSGIMLALLHWREAPSPVRLALPVGLMALSMGNHAATVLLAPACLLFVVFSAPKTLLNYKAWLACGAALLLGLTIFFYIPLRYAANPVFNYAGQYDASGVFHPVNLRDLQNIWWLISGQSFSGQMFGYSFGEVGGQIASYLQQLVQAFVGIGIIPALLGMGLLLRRDWRLALFLVLIFGGNALFYINYRVVDKNTMFLPTYVVWAILLGIGYQWLLDQVTHEEPSRSRRATAYHSMASIIILAVVFAASWNWQRVDRSADFSTREQAQTILDQAEPNAIILGWWETVPAIEYLQLVEGQRPDVLAINRFLIDGKALQELLLTEVNHRPIYINSPPQHLKQAITFERVGQLYRLKPRVLCSNCPY